MHLRKSSTDNRPPDLWTWNTNKREQKPRQPPYKKGNGQ
jgi:hypothetical protein